MIKIDSTKKLYPLWTMLIGLISFLISGLIVSLIPLGFLIQFMIAGSIGSLIMLFMLCMLDKKKLMNVVFLSAFGAFIALFMGFGLGEGIALFFPPLANIVGSITMNVTFGAVFAFFSMGESQSVFLPQYVE